MVLIINGPVFKSNRRPLRRMASTTRTYCVHCSRGWHCTTWDWLSKKVVLWFMMLVLVRHRQTLHMIQIWIRSRYWCISNVCWLLISLLGSCYGSTTTDILLFDRPFVIIVDATFLLSIICLDSHLLICLFLVRLIGILFDLLRLFQKATRISKWINHKVVTLIICEIGINWTSW